MLFILGIIVGILLANISIATSNKQSEIRERIINKLSNNEAVIIDSRDILEEIIPDNYEYTTDRK